MINKSSQFVGVMSGGKMKRDNFLVWLMVIVSVSLAPPVVHAQTFSSDHEMVAQQESRVRKEILRDKVGICVALSGGGLRASAFHAGVLDGIQEALQNIDPDGNGIDVISGISGGAITAALFALHPGLAWQESGINRLRNFISSRPVHTSIRTILGGERSFSERSQLFEQILNKHLYQGKTIDKMRPYPYLVLGTTDLRTGQLGAIVKCCVWRT